MIFFDFKAAFPPGTDLYFLRRPAPAVAPVSQPVPGDQSDGGYSLTRNSKVVPLDGADAMAIGAPLSVPGAFSWTYWPPLV